MDASLECASCGASYALQVPFALCDCGGLFRVRGVARFPFEEISRRAPSLWRYAEALPVAPVITLGEGMTPLLGETIGDRSFLVKCEYRNPTGSFKDRGAAMVVNHLVHAGVRAVRADSSGNAGIALAAFGARAGLAVRIFVPESAPETKTSWIEGFGAQIRRVPGPRSAAADACRTEPGSDVYAGHAVHPLFLQGTKTVAYEIAEALDWRAPDGVIVPVGNGTLLLGLYAGFRDLAEARVTALPRLVGVQPEICSPIAALHWTGDTGAEWKPSVADGLSVDRPPRAREVVEAVRATRGDFVTVGEESIEDAARVLRLRGHAVCRNAAAGVAGALAWLGRESRGRWVVVLTGRSRP